MTNQSSSKNTTWQRWQEIIKIWHEEKLFFQVFTALFFIGIGVGFGSGLFPGDSGYSVNIYTEILSVFFTIFVLNLLQERRDERRRVDDLKERLVREVRSQSPEVAKAAISELGENGWLEGDKGLLKGQNLTGVQLADAKLSGINFAGANLANANFHSAILERVTLEEANLEFADLRHANLSFANMQKVVMRDGKLEKSLLWSVNLAGSDLGVAQIVNAHLTFSNLSGVILYKANLNGTDLRAVNLCDANLQFADLRNAYLVDANLTNAKLDYVKFNELTTLPNDKKWTSETDIEIFTNPSHPNFWRSDDPLSSAYRGDE